MAFTTILLKLFGLLAFVLGVYGIAVVRYRKGKRLGWVITLVLALLFGWLSLQYGAEVELDRVRYAGHYEGGYDVSYNSWGLNWYFEFCRSLGLGTEGMFQVFSTFCFLVILVSYNLSRQATPLALLLLLMSQCFVFCFSIIKQGISESLVMVALVLLFNIVYQEKRSATVALMVAIVLLTGVAIIFHEAAYIMIPVLLMLAMWNNKAVRVVGYVGIAFGLVAFGWLRSQYAAHIGNYSETLAEQSAAYVQGPTVVKNLLEAGKGIPMYIVAAVGVAGRKWMGEKIENYDRYLCLAVLCSAIYLVSVVVVWYARFAYYLLFPVYVFAAQMIKTSREEGRRPWWLYGAVAVAIILQVRNFILYFVNFGGF